MKHCLVPPYFFKRMSWFWYKMIPVVHRKSEWNITTTICRTYKSVVSLWRPSSQQLGFRRRRHPSVCLSPVKFVKSFATRQHLQPSGGLFNKLYYRIDSNALVVVFESQCRTGRRDEVWYVFVVFSQQPPRVQLTFPLKQRFDISRVDIDMIRYATISRYRYRLSKQHWF